MSSKYSWSDYNLRGPPPISYDDWMITAYGRTEDLENALKDIEYYSSQGVRKLWRIIEFWGTGKSTFLFNLSYQINDRFFFNDALEKPEIGIFRHVLGIYNKEPKRKRELLDYVYNDGLAVPWSAEISRDEASLKREEYWKRAVQKICYLLLRKAIFTIDKQGLNEDVIGGSAYTEELLKKIHEVRAVSTNEFIDYILKLFESDDRVLEEIGEIMKFYMRLLMPSLEERRTVKQADFETYFPRMLYPIRSTTFLNSYRALLTKPQYNLRQYSAFEKIMKEINSFTVICIDEVEDWSQITRSNIDVDLHDISTDAQSPTWLLLAFRTEIIRRIRNESRLERYTTIMDRCVDIRFSDFDQAEIHELTSGILHTARIGEQSIFPFSEDFIIKLARMTTRERQRFNVRSYLRALINILEVSLEWERDSVEITSEYLEKDEVLAAIEGILVSEEEEARAGIANIEDARLE